MSSMNHTTGTVPAHHEFSGSDLSSAQQMTLSIIPHITGPLSCLGSALIMRDVIQHEGTRSAYQRLLFGMSLCDFVTSLWYSFSTIPVPVGTPGVWAPAGTTGTCTAQGFFIQLSLTTALYNSSLSIYYVLLGCCKWNEERIRGVEPYMHSIPLAVGFSTSFAGLGLKLFNNANLWCWIAPLPFDCRQSFHGMGETNCVRGDNASIYRMYLFYIPLWTSILLATTAMGLVYYSVLQREQEVDSFQTDGIALRKQSRRVAWQSFWYILAFYVSWLPASLHCFIEMLPHVVRANYVAGVMMAVFAPLQGLLNFLVYFRAKLVKFRRNHPENTVIASVGRVMLHANPNSSSAAMSPKMTRLDSNVAPIPASQMGVTFVENCNDNFAEGIDGCDDFEESHLNNARVVEDDVQHDDTLAEEDMLNNNVHEKSAVEGCSSEKHSVDHVDDKHKSGI